MERLILECILNIKESVRGNGLIRLWIGIIRDPCETPDSITRGVSCYKDVPRNVDSCYFRLVLDIAHVRTFVYLSLISKYDTCPVSRLYTDLSCKRWSCFTESAKIILIYSSSFLIYIHQCIHIEDGLPPIHLNSVWEKKLQNIFFNKAMNIFPTWFCKVGISIK